MDGGLMEVLKDFIREALFEVVQDLLGTEDFRIQIEPGSKKGENFMGILYRIIFFSVDEKRSSKLYLKMAPENEEQRQQIRARHCFLREMYMYREVLPYFREFQESRNVTVNKDGFHEFTQCFKSLDEEPFECLFLQDVTMKKFVLVDKSQLTVEHILLVMKSIGKFHATSLALKDQDPIKFTEIIKDLREQHFKHGYTTAWTSLYNDSAMTVIDAITDDNDVHLLQAVLKLYEQNQFDTLADCVNAQEAEPYSVILHGDLWSNNTLFKLNGKNKPKKVCLIDWQQSRYASPALDLLYYIFITTTRDLRGRNYNIYLKTYHDALSMHLLRLGSNPDKVFPYIELLAQLQRYGKFGLVNASLVLPIMHGEPTRFKSFDSNGKVDQLTSNQIGYSVEFKKRMRDIVADMLQLGYI